MSFFVTRDGKQPRFCKYGRDIDAMAEMLVWEGYKSNYKRSRWTFGDGAELHSTKEKAIEAAKEWLLDVEEE